MKRVVWSSTKGSGGRGESLGHHQLDGVVFYHAGSGELPLPHTALQHAVPTTWTLN